MTFSGIAIRFILALPGCEVVYVSPLAFGREEIFAREFDGDVENFLEEAGRIGRMRYRVDYEVGCSETVSLIPREQSLNLYMLRRVP